MVGLNLVLWAAAESNPERAGLVVLDVFSCSTCTALNLCVLLCSGEVTVGKITYYSEKILGYGSEGTIVFQ